jgi:transcription elongation GreA/GreB family factor
VARSSVGAKVTLKDTFSGKTLAYTLVDVREADVTQGKISTTSPVGQALLDRMVGEEVTINVPKGTLRYLVQRITAIS